MSQFLPFLSFTFFHPTLAMIIVRLAIILLAIHPTRTLIIDSSISPSILPIDIDTSLSLITPSPGVDSDFSNTITINEARSNINPNHDFSNTITTNETRSSSIPSPPLPPPPLPRTHNFCQRTITKTSCPNPRTISHLNLSAYMGTWYQFASTARYTLNFQAGLVCEQANHTLLSNFDGIARIAAINSGAAVISTQEAATLTRLSPLSNRICTAAKSVCHLTTPPHSRLRQNLRTLWNSLSLLSASHPSIAADLQRQIRRSYHLVRLVESGMESLSINVSQIQQAYGRISMDQGLRWENLRQLTEAISGTLSTVRDITYQIYSRNYIRRQILYIAANLAAENPSLARRITNSAIQIASEFAKIESDLAQTGFLLTNLEAGSVNFGGRADFRRGNKVVINGLGFQNWSTPGKLEMDFYGVKSPYWVIALEGSAREGYRASMVYSCKESLNGDIYEDLFVLSRSGVVEDEVMARFMEIAGTYEISTDCDNPLILTEQRGGSCGAPYTSNTENLLLV